ncbi:metallophosphoesterase [Carnobacterium jeotgali]|uniref:metallophosphoesterase n=1 Tax=Carnobacterium jeotgali TaxID=545534 RepID=UPI003C74D29D
MSGWTIVGIIVAIVCSIILYLYLQNTQLQRKKIEIQLPFTENNLSGTKIIHLSDFHLPRQGVSLKKLIEKVAKEKPDMIALTGDLIDVRADFPQEQLEYLCRALVEIAPTFAVTGNHDLSSGHLQKWETTLTSAGVRVLIDEADWLPVGDDGLVVMGLSEKEDFNATPKPILRGVMIEEPLRTKPRILLAHRPELFEEYLMDLTRVPALTLSGHAHGGQIRLPLLGGLFAPGQGKFPAYTSGIYYDPEMPAYRMMVSRGIGNSTFPLRVNNRPEMVVIVLH